MAAWTWYGPGWPRRRQRRTRSWPSAIRSRSHRPRSWSASRTRPPSGVVRAAPPGLGQQHEREQADDLGLVGHQRGQQPPEPDRLGAQVLADQLVAGAGRVALVEDQVDDGQHGPQAVGQVGLVGHAVRDPRVADLALGPDEPLRHGRLGDQEGPRDLGRGQAAQQAQRQRHLGGRGQRRVTAGEDEAEPVVAHRSLRLLGLVAGMQQGGLGVPVGAGRLPAQPVDGPVAGGGDDPAGRARRQPGGRPPLARRR